MNNYETQAYIFNEQVHASRDKSLSLFESGKWPDVIWTHRMNSPVRIVRRFVHDSVLDFRSASRMINKGRKRAIKPKEDVQ
jgi:hypothetical protein